MKRRRRGPRGAAFFHVNDGNLMHMEEQQVSSGSAARTGGLEDPESSVANQTPDDSGTREAPAHSVGHYECCIRQGLSPVLMPLPGLAPVFLYFGLRPAGRLSLPK